MGSSVNASHVAAALLIADPAIDLSPRYSQLLQERGASMAESLLSVTTDPEPLEFFSTRVLRRAYSQATFLGCSGTADRILTVIGGRL